MEQMVSVIMPVYGTNKCREFFKEAIARLAKQTYKNFELIMVCDNSIQDDINCALRFRDIFFNDQNKNKVKIFGLKKQVGPEIAKNYGIKFAEGKYLTFNDQDDYSELDRIEKLVKSMGNDFIIMSWVREDGLRKRTPRYERQDFAKWLVTKKIHPPHCSSIMIKKAYFEYFGGFEEVYSDYMFTMKLSLFRGMFGLEGINVYPEALYVYNRHVNAATSTTKSFNQRRDRFQIEIRDRIIPSVALHVDSRILSGEEIKNIVEIKDNLSKIDMSIVKRII